MHRKGDFDTPQPDPDLVWAFTCYTPPNTNAPVDPQNEDQELWRPFPRDALGPDFHVDISSSSSQLTHFIREVVLAGHLQALADMIDTEIDQQKDRQFLSAYSIAHSAACDGEDLEVEGASIDPEVI